ncbi:uncharacterized protein TNCV_3717641 [Trichonephila clavipes]|nr:uncharacterized protein TNCV_3717641 [Trichonephila clavipes]
MHLDNFLRGRIIGRLECGRTQPEVLEELGIEQSVISRQRFQDDGNVSRRYSTGLPSYNAERGLVFGNYCQKKQTEHSIRPVS